MLKEPTEIILENIADSALKGAAKSNENGICIHDIHTINACNHVYSGTVDHEGICYGFQIEMGDIRGCEIHKWGLEEDVGIFDQGPPPEQRTFIPSNPFLFDENPEMFDVYCAWRNEQWFRDKIGAYNYDRHFQPGSCTEKYYKDWAAKKSMKIGYLSDLSNEEQKRIKENENG